MDERAAQNFLVQLGQFARDGGAARAQHFGHVGQAFGQSGAGLIEYKCARHGGEFAESPHSRRLLGRQESSKEEGVGRQACARECG